MKSPIVHDTEPITLVGGGKVKKSLLCAAIDHAPKIIAADGAAQAVLRHGFMPDAVIGDFDSLSQASMAQIPDTHLHEISEQDSTDFEKCLSRIEAPLVIGVGFEGGRLDHQLAALHGLMHYPERSCVLLGKTDLVFLAPPQIRLNLPEGTRFSLFPMARVNAISEGLRWPIEGLKFEPGQKIGTSNHVTGPVRIETDRPAMLIILPVKQMALVVRALRQPGLARWSALSER